MYHASAVLPDGRVIIMGGEYNGSGTEVWTNLGAIYDPLANKWTAVAAPTETGWTRIGDAQSTVLADGTFLLASCCAYPAADALLNAQTLSWTGTGAPTAGESYQDEQGYELLPNGNVLTIDVWTNGGGATNAEQYVESSGIWTSAGNTPVSLVDPAVCGNWEIGPAVLRADGTLVAFGGNTGCPGVSPTDPTAIYDSIHGTWSKGPNVPAVCGSSGKTSCTLADAPAALLPNGNILFAASAGYGEAPTHFFEFTASNAIDQVADTVDYASSSSSYFYNFLVLPNGQILSTDFSNVPEFYTPIGSANTAWAPVISAAPSAVFPGGTYSISGSQFNGLSQGAYYGDDVQGATNYPIVRITNEASSHVFYARTFDASTVSIAPDTKVSTNFTVPKDVETGASDMVVIANGIASEPVVVNVEEQHATTTTTVAASVNPSTLGQAVTFTATVGPAGPPVPTGTVAFTSNSAAITGCSAVTLTSSRTATCTTTALTKGTDTIKASYAGNSDYTSSSGTVTQRVNMGVSITTVVSSKNQSTVGQTVTFTATVGPAGPPVPTGTVAFTSNGAAITGCSAVTLTSSRTADCTTTALTKGTDTVKASYSGNSDYSSSSGTVTQTVNTSTTTVVSSKNPSMLGQAVTFTATVGPAGPRVPTGTVAFTSNGATITGCSAVTLTSSRTATCTTTALTKGTDTIKASYSGNSDYTSSSCTVTQTVNNSTTTVVSSKNPSTLGQSVTFTATVGPAGPPVPTGTVAFTSNGTAITGCSTVTLTSSRTAACTTTALTKGTDTVKASFSGKSDYTSSNGTVTQTVN
jgi:hypothetical protein